MSNYSNSDIELFSADSRSSTDSDTDLSKYSLELAELEEEKKRLKEIQNEIGRKMRITPPMERPKIKIPTPEEKSAADARSVYIGNVDYSATVEEIKNHFLGCGSITRVSIQYDKFSGKPKGFAYAEFSDKEGMQNGLAMSDSLFKGRQIKVSPKRTNIRGISTTNRGRARAPVTIIKYVIAGPRPTRGVARGRGRGRFNPY